MKHWINKNYRTLIIAAFVIPIITVAIVSISHVTKWYGVSNPMTWAIYLSIGIEIAAMSALAAISAKMGKNVYFPFIIVTIVQFIGNVFFSYQYIDVNNEMFKSWVELASPIVSFMGVESTDLIGHKRFLALFAGGLLPIISLSFLHMLIKFTEEDRIKDVKEEEMIHQKEIEEIIKHKVDEELKHEETETTVNETVTVNQEELKKLVEEEIRLKLTENDLKKIEEILLNPPKPNENLIKAKEKYYEDVEKYYDDLEKENSQVNETLKDIQEKQINDFKEINDNIDEELEGILNNEAPVLLSEEKLKQLEDFMKMNYDKDYINETKEWDETLNDDIDEYLEDLLNESDDIPDDIKETTDNEIPFDEIDVPEIYEEEFETEMPDIQAEIDDIKTEITDIPDIEPEPSDIGEKKKYN